MTLGCVDVRTSNTKLFSSIAIETSSACNRRCEFCPVAYNPRPDDEYMSHGMFDNIVEQLRLLDYRGRVEFYIYNEPLLDADLLELVQHARSELPRACLMINTNGDYIRGFSDIMELLDAGINQLGINVYSHDRRYQELLRLTGDLNDKDSLYQNIGPNKQVVKVVPKFSITRDSIGLPGVDHISNRAGNIPNFVPPLDEPLSRMCTRPFRFLNIDWLGRAMLCCNDYTVRVDVGTVGDTSLLELWNSVQFNLFRLKLQNRDRRIPVCDVCDFTGGYYPHMIYEVTFGVELDEYIIGCDLEREESYHACVDHILSAESTRWS